MSTTENLPALPADAPPSAGTARSFRPLRSIVALILREMSSRYGRSPGGYLWAILEPLGGIVVLGIAFSFLMRSPPIGTSFLLFYAAGFVPFTLYMNISNMVARALIYSKPLLMYPTVTWMDAIIARFLLNLLTGILVGFIVMVTILLFVDEQITLDLVPIALTMCLTPLLALGVGVLNCVLIGLLDAWAQVWSILTRPLFLASGIFITYEQMPKTLQDILWYNPLIHLSGLMREGFYGTYNASYISITYIVVFSLICLFLGVVLLGRYHHTILERR